MSEGADYIIMFFRMAIEAGLLTAILLALRQISRQLTAVESRLVQVLVNDELQKRQQ